MKLKDHEIAAIFPLLSETEMEGLARDIKENGLREPITLYEGKILDGRNRYRACVVAGVEPGTKEFRGDSPVAFVISANLKRRHLTESQKAAVAQDVLPLLEKEAKERRNANLKRGDGKPVKEIIPERERGESRDHAAKLLGVNPRYVSDAKKINEQKPGLFEKVRSGKTTIPEAIRELKRDEYVEKVKAASAEKQTVLAPQGPFDLILADPPWRYEHCEANNREIENHYSTERLEDIFKHSPDAQSDSILFLWATAPKLAEALDVMKQWGFTYRSCAVWDKQKIGMGYWWRIQHELLLVGIKGDPGCTPEPARISSIFAETRTAHSKKPMAVYEWIEKAFPSAKKLEMYCRSPRPGWAVWGNEV
jgi:N6-adenosine-specific RNA methylase IME4